MHKDKKIEAPIVQKELKLCQLFLGICILLHIMVVLCAGVFSTESLAEIINLPWQLESICGWLMLFLPILTICIMYMCGERYIHLKFDTLEYFNADRSKGRTIAMMIFIAIEGIIALCQSMTTFLLIMGYWKIIEALLLCLIGNVVLAAVWLLLFWYSLRNLEKAGIRGRTKWWGWLVYVVVLISLCVVTKVSREYMGDEVRLARWIAMEEYYENWNVLENDEFSIN